MAEGGTTITKDDQKTRELRRRGEEIVENTRAMKKTTVPVKTLLYYHREYCRANVLTWETVRLRRLHLHSQSYTACPTNQTGVSSLLNYRSASILTLDSHRSFKLHRQRSDISTWQPGVRFGRTDPIANFTRLHHQFEYTHLGLKADRVSESLNVT